MANVNVCLIYSRIFIQFVLILQKLAAHLNQRMHLTLNDLCLIFTKYHP